MVIKQKESAYETISPFELKNQLIRLAEDQQGKSTRTLLNAGRGNPNWISATPREAFFYLGLFSVGESRRVHSNHDLAGMPEKAGIAARLTTYVSENTQALGMMLLRDIVMYGVQQKGFDADNWVYELVDGIIGDHYPEPDRMLKHVEQVVQDYLILEMCQNDASIGPFHLFAVEGATAAMCYLFDSLWENRLLNQKDRIAIMVPIFPPYVEIPNLARYDFDVVEIRATGTDQDGDHTWQYPASEIEKLADPSIKALFLVNPSNPPSVAMQPETVAKLIDVVKMHNPQLMILTDDVYGTFVDSYRSLMADLPHNTVGVYSFSKYFGVTGWRLGVIAIHENNILDERLRQLSAEEKTMLDQRYASLTQHPADLLFIDRIVADSRQVALNHTAGLSTPQQVQMAMFSVFALLDHQNNGDRYKGITQEICRRRMTLLYDGLGIPSPQLLHGANYYTEFDLLYWADHHYGKAFTDYLQKNYEPVDIVFRLAKQSSIVLLPGGGFYGPNWSVRVSLANLDDGAYVQIGHALHMVLTEYVTAWRTAVPN